MRKLIAVVFCLWMVCPVASQIGPGIEELPGDRIEELSGNRWKYIGRATDESFVYIDARTIVRPSNNEVIFWMKTVGSQTKKTRVKMWRMERQFQVVGVAEGPPGYSGVADITPEGLMEAFYDRLFK